MHIIGHKEPKRADQKSGLQASDLLSDKDPADRACKIEQSHKKEISCIGIAAHKSLTRCYKIDRQRLHITE